MLVEKEVRGFEKIGGIVTKRPSLAFMRKIIATVFKKLTHTHIVQLYFLQRIEGRHH